MSAASSAQTSRRSSSTFICPPTGDAEQPDRQAIERLGRGPSALGVMLDRPMLACALIPFLEPQGGLYPHSGGSHKPAITRSRESTSPALMRTAAALLLVSIVMAGCGSASGADRSSLIATRIGGTTTCSQTRFYITFRSDNSREQIYDCQTGSGEKCVTYANGVVNDRTFLAKDLFANTLGADARPSCAS